MDLQLVEDVTHVELDGVIADAQFFGRSLVVVTVGEKFQQPRFVAETLIAAASIVATHLGSSHPGVAGRHVQRQLNRYAGALSHCGLDIEPAVQLVIAWPICAK